MKATGSITRSVRQLIPTVLTVVETAERLLYYLEAVNNTGGDVALTVYDQAGLIVIPTQTVSNGKIITYRSDLGTPVTGLSWIASAPGLVGWYAGE